MEKYFRVKDWLYINFDVPENQLSEEIKSLIKMKRREYKLFLENIEKQISELPKDSTKAKMLMQQANEKGKTIKKEISASISHKLEVHVSE